MDLGTTSTPANHPIIPRAIITQAAASISSNALAKSMSRIFTSGNANNGRLHDCNIIIRDKYENVHEGRTPVAINKHGTVAIRSSRVP